MQYENIVGNKYGRLLVLEELKGLAGNRFRYLVKCQCDCGNITVAEKSKVKGGQTISCGCAQQEMRKALGSHFKKKPGEAAFNETYGAYRKTALHRGYSFKLTKDQFREIITKPCIYCGDELTQEKAGTNGSFKYTGIDRYDNSIGYEYENCVPCCSVCNRIKTDMSISDMERRLEKILSRKNVWKRTG